MEKVFNKVSDEEADVTITTTTRITRSATAYARELLLSEIADLRNSIAPTMDKITAKEGELAAIDADLAAFDTKDEKGR